ncbi:hypothetical protein DH2020_042349 [Rehmannia glutinosa]|uniref:Pectinesterase inhibitor domain-containing protein n=1 Tax=Rehmannia glutinosa TaxID=99300 RepID=A0ABR0UN74_REHGL
MAVSSTVPLLLTLTVLCCLLPTPLFLSPPLRKLNWPSKSIKLIGGGGNPDIIKGLKSCLGNYNEAVRAINEVLGDLNDESYYDFDKLSLDAEKNLRACENGFHGRSPITQRNVVAIKLANICYVVSKLFQYND